MLHVPVPQMFHGGAQRPRAAVHEVDTLFHEMPRHEKIERVKKAKDIVKAGEKTVKKVERCWPENLKESLEECLVGDIE